MSQPLLFILLVILNCVIAAPKTYCLPNAPCWPVKDDWDALNITVEGQLLHLHRPTCSGIIPEIRTLDASCVLWDNTQHEDISLRKPLIHPEYAVHVRNVSHAQAAMNFAAAHNIRLTIKTSGHSFAGRSNSKGSLLVWMQGFNKVHMDEKYSDGCSQGPAITVQGGATWHNVYPVVHPKYQVIGGYTLSVAVTGGFMQGGGHSPLTGSGGLAVDSVLSMDVVTADGNVVTANPCQNTDLFFALRGGGGGTWGIVTSCTLRMHLAPPYGVGFNLLVPLIEKSVGHSFIDTWVRMQPQLGSVWGGYLLKGGPEAIFHGYCNADMETCTRTMQPLKNWHNKHALAGIIWEMTKVRQGFWHWHTNITTPCGPNVQMGSRLVPMENFEGDKAKDLVETTYKHLKESDIGEFWGILIGGVTASADPNKTSSITPAFRKAQWHMILAPNMYKEPGEEKAIKRAEAFRSDFEKLTPDSGAYFNEMSYYEPDWKYSFFGPNYDRLLKIKKKYDPNGIMSCHHCVGSDE